MNTMNVKCGMSLKTEIITKAIGLILFAIGIEHITRSNYQTALFFIAGGGLISIAPFLYKS